MSDIVERLEDMAATGIYPKEVREAAAEIGRLRALLQKLRWKSIDKDNMEFRCDTTCYVMNEIRLALEPMP